MTLDTVHDVQHAYRKLVQATSFPGTIVSISHEAQKIDLPTELPRPLLLLAMMLLDAEVAFSIDSQHAERDASLISRVTYSREVSRSQAAFVLVANPEQATEAIRDARVGTLTDPHLGATVVLLVETLREVEPGEAVADDVPTFELAGPGVQSTRRIAVGAPADWMEARARQNAEYPLGIDALFVTRDGALLSLPRTTQVSRVEG
ncbi:MAG: phosphonate C-P lyase system protein PhnH [Spirochaetota bacterium]